ncbi:hypothetical protein BDV95DRAFT_217114 [Massariosphaeria phaeospora]|uniref:3'-5' exonuclease domain-containing protein n=1 Tax=Massariosphaeria phaeospora TaxID=100035 RepID=A0A7C8MEA8_9PLEO|nr:hypothetical protein BDV95DRAFT_217114 [Massariosphaeria phaeospora]
MSFRRRAVLARALDAEQYRRLLFGRLAIRSTMVDQTAQRPWAGAEREGLSTSATGTTTSTAARGAEPSAPHRTIVKKHGSRLSQTPIRERRHNDDPATLLRPPQGTFATGLEEQQLARHEQYVGTVDVRTRARATRPLGSEQDRRLKSLQSVQTPPLPERLVDTHEDGIIAHIGGPSFGAREILSKSLVYRQCSVATIGKKDYVKLVAPSRVQNVDTKPARHALQLSPSPRLFAPHPTPFFNGACEVRESVHHSNHVTESGSGTTMSEPTPSTGQQQSTEKPDDPEESENNNTTTTDTPSTASMRDASDPDFPSDGEHGKEANQNSDHEQGQESEADSSAELSEDDAQEEHVPLSYQIPTESLRAAMEARPKTKAAYWRQQLYRGPEGETIATHYCRTLEVAEKVAKYFLEEKVLGFDIEWKPMGAPWCIKENASLIQLACENRIALFHIAQFRGSTVAQLMPPTLKAILESPDILKVGVAIKGDFTRLENHLKVKGQGKYELSRLHTMVEYHFGNVESFNHKLVGLAPQVHQHLQLPLYKGEELEDDDAVGNTEADQKNRVNVRSSDWSLPLDTAQIHYAAADAYAGLRLWDVLESKRKKLRPTPERPPVCDFDAKRQKPKPKTARKPKKAVQKTAAEAMDEAGTEALEAEEDGEDDAQAYETAAEELPDGQESEAAASSESDMSDTSDQSEDPDADYLPSTRSGTSSTAPVHSASTSPATPQPRSRRIGRINLSARGTSDLKYPKLPVLDATDSEASSASDSDSSDAFDPPQPRSRRRQDREITVAQPSVAPVVHDAVMEADDEFADAELEEVLLSLSLDLDQWVEEERVALGPKDDEPQGDIDTADDVLETVERPGTPAVIGRVESGTSEPNLSALPPSSFPPIIPPTTTTTPTAPTPEYTLAHTWALTYLLSTIPSPNPSPTAPPPASAPHYPNCAPTTYGTCSSCHSRPWRAICAIRRLVCGPCVAVF